MAPEVEVVVGYHSHCCTDQEAEAEAEDYRSHYCIDQDLDRAGVEVANCICDIHIRRKG
ncbi:hypothetical protein [Acidithiobacillus acidisediminis]|uniref:hypothetical protein n=1 Tax=Acidithiobacillus TaxID=119977 RepID=UPI00200FAD51|nr:hypothetical protein [Acidithiobacillus sp. S30A2]